MAAAAFSHNDTLFTSLPIGPFVGYVHPSRCWNPGLSRKSRERCCLSDRSVCFADEQYLFESCCLGAALPSTFPHQDYFVDFWSELHYGGGMLMSKVNHSAKHTLHLLTSQQLSLGIDRLFADIESSVIVGHASVASLSVQEMLWANCVEAELYKMLLHATKQLATQLVLATGEIMTCFATNLLRIAGSLAPAVAVSPTPCLTSVSQGVSKFDANLKRIRDVFKNRASIKYTDDWCNWQLPGLDLEKDVFDRHANRVHRLMQVVSAQASEMIQDGSTTIFRSSLDSLLFTSSQLLQANVLLASQTVFIKYVMQSNNKRRFSYQLKLGPWACCDFPELVEEVALRLFEKRSLDALRVVELGIDAGRTSLRLLQRFPWIAYYGVDGLVNDGRDYTWIRSKQLYLQDLRSYFKPYADRAQLLVPMTTTEAGALFAAHRMVVDVVILDARFDRDGMLDDLHTWLPLISLGGCVVARAGFDHLLSFLKNRSTIFGHKLGPFHIGSVQDGNQFFFCVNSSVRVSESAKKVWYDDPMRQA